MAWHHRPVEFVEQAFCQFWGNTFALAKINQPAEATVIKDLWDKGIKVQQDILVPHQALQ